jgi:hypothetical protein
MAHYAFLDENNTVTEVIVGKNENEDNIDWEVHYGNFRGQPCKQTSYNTRGGVHYDAVTNEPSQDQSKAFRKNYAGVGYMYDAERDAFILPQPFASWILDEETCLWNSPIPYPADIGTEESPKRYTWDEETVSWTLVEAVPA